MGRIFLVAGIRLKEHHTIKFILYTSQGVNFRYKATFPYMIPEDEKKKLQSSWNSDSKIWVRQPYHVFIVWERKQKVLYKWTITKQNSVTTESGHWQYLKKQ